MKTYDFKVCFGEGRWADGVYSVQAEDEDMATGIALKEICDKLYAVLPELDIEVTVELVEANMINDLDAFEKAMKEKYPYLVDITDEEYIEGQGERYIAWLKFPYYSTDSDGGFFTFFTEREFEEYITSSIRMFTEEEIKNEGFEVCQYGYDFDNEEFDLDKALYLLYRARMEMPKTKF